MSDGENGWKEYQLLVLHELKTHSQDLVAIRGELQKLHIEISALKVKSGMWGLIGGVIPVAIALGMKLLS